jgi:hypothetical protein
MESCPELRGTRAGTIGRLSNVTPQLFYQSMQLGFGNGEFRETATRTDQKLREYQDRRLVEAFPAGKEDANLASKLCLVF